MALIKCPECQKAVSDKATACPHCGHPIAARDYPPGLAPDDLTAAVRAEGRVGSATHMGKQAIKEAARQEEQVRRELATNGNSRGFGGIALIAIIIVGVYILGSSGGPDTNSCAGNWRKCSDNADLVNNYRDINNAQWSCQFAADKLAMYGTPKWPLPSFGTFYRGDDYLKTGIATLVEQNAQFSNTFGGMVHTTATCKYDLNQKKVLDVSIAPN